jgi:putative DNA primase/helicase
MEAKELKLLAAGRWASIVTSLAPHLAQAVERTPNHVPCPVHGGTDGFRLFRDFDETGGGVCNTCGIHHDGYTLLMWANGWDFLTTHRAIHDMLLGSGEKHYAPLPAKKVCVKKEENRQDIRDSLNHVWKASIPLTSPKRGQQGCILQTVESGRSTIEKLIAR